MKVVGRNSNIDFNLTTDDFKYVPAVIEMEGYSEYDLSRFSLVDEKAI